MKPIIAKGESDVEGKNVENVIHKIELLGHFFMYINADRSEEESTGWIRIIQVDAVYTNAKICGNLASSYPSPSVCLRYHSSIALCQ